MVADGVWSAWGRTIRQPDFQVTEEASQSTTSARRADKPRNVRKRLTIIGVIILALVVAAGALVLVRSQRREAAMEASRVEGLQLLADEDYERARVKIGPYVNYVERSDPVTLFAYARATEEVEQPRNKHLNEAVAFYRDYLDRFPQGPDAPEAQRRVAQLYGKLGAWEELLQATSDLESARVGEDATDGTLERLRLRGLALAVEGQLTEAQSVLDAYLARRPLDADAQIMALSLERATSRGDEGQAAADLRVADLVEQFGDGDARIKIVQAADASLRNEPEQAQQLAREAAQTILGDGLADEPQNDITDRLVRRFVNILDGSSQATLATDVVASLAGQLGDDSVRLIAANRLARAGRLDALLQLTENLTDRAPGELLGLRAIAFVEQGDAAALAGARQALLDRPAESSARAWEAILDSWQVPSARLAPLALVAATDPVETSPEKRLAAAEAALTIYSHPYFEQLKAEALLDAGEATPAMVWAERASSARDGRGPWQRSLMSIALAAATAGEAQVASSAMQAIRTVFPEDATAAAGVAMLLAAAGNGEEAASILEAADQRDVLVSFTQAILNGSPLPEATATLPPRLVLAGVVLAGERQAETAERLVEQLEAMASATPVQQQTARAILNVLQKNDASFSVLCADGASAIPARLTLLAAQDRPAATELAQQVAGSASPSLAAGRVIWSSSVLDATDEAQWKLLRKLTAAMEEALADNAVEWTVRLARLDLNRPSGTADDATMRDHALALGRVMRLYPRHRQGRLTLIGVLERLGLDDQVQEQLEAGVAALPNDVSMRLELAAMQIRGGGDAGDQLRILEANATRLRPAERRRLAELFEAVGDDRRALAVLGDDDDAAGKRFQLGLREGTISDADIQAATQSTDPTILRLAAEQLARQGNAEEALAAVDRLGTDGGLDQAAVTEVRVVTLALLGQQDKALATTDAAIENAPTNVELRRLQAVILLSQNNLAEASASAKASAQVTDGEAKEKFQAFGDALSAAMQAAGDAPPSDALVLAPEILSAPSAEAAKAVSDVVVLLARTAQQQQGEPTREVAKSILSDMTAAADKATHSQMLQKVAIRTALAAGEGDVAVERARALVQADRRDPEATRLLVDAEAISGNNEAALEAVNQWRDRLSRQDADATTFVLVDVTAARLELALDRPARAVTLLRPHASDPDAAPALLLLDAQARSATGDYRGALATLGGKNAPAPDTPLRAAWLTAAIQAAVEGDRDALSALAATGSEAAGRDDVRELLSTGQALAAVLAKRPDDTIKASLTQVVQQLAAQPATDDSGRLSEQVGMLAGSTGDDALAEQAYRTALAARQDLPIARNNLAMLLIGQDESAAKQEALNLVDPLLSRADVRQSPAYAAILDTRASIAVAMGDLAAAVTFIDSAIEEQPDEPEWHIHKAEVLAEQGDASASRQALRQADRVSNAALDRKLQRRVDDLRMRLDAPAEE